MSGWLTKTMAFRYGRVLGLTLLLALGFFAPNSAAADDEESLLSPPPYVTADGLCVSIGVKWDEAALAKIMPSVLKPLPDLTGAINICEAKRGSVIAPLADAEFSVDVASFAPADQGSWTWDALMLVGPNPVVVNTLREYYGEQMILGDVRITETKTGYRATGSLDGKEVVAIEVKLSDEPCEENASSTFTFVDVRERTGEIVLSQFPVAPDVCFGEPVSAKVTALPGNALLSALQPKELLYAAVGKNAAIGWGYPMPIGWSAPAEE